MNIFINFFKILFQNRKDQRKTDIFVLKMSVCQQSEHSLRSALNVIQKINALSTEVFYELLLNHTSYVLSL